MSKKFDLEALSRIAIEEVLEALGAVRKNDKVYKCPNGAFHKSGEDKNASLGIDKAKNICKCFACGEIQGNSISVAKWHFGGDFVKACQWLSDGWNIAYLDGTSNQNKSFAKVAVQKIDKEIKYIEFDINKKYQEIDKDRYKKLLKSYHKMSDEQKLKMVYTYIYRFSLSSNQDEKFSYFKSRGIENNKYLDLIGTITQNDLKQLLVKLEKIFTKEDLAKFNLYNNSTHEKYPNKFKYGYINSTLFLIPSFDIYTNMITGFMIRPKIKEKWISAKEVRVCVSDIVEALPFKLDREMLFDDTPICITEGSIDGLSLGDNHHIVSLPGVEAFKEEYAKLFKSRVVYIIFDMDEAGKNGAIKVAKCLSKNGAYPIIINWDSNLGNDINELLVNKKIDVIKNQIK